MKYTSNYSFKKPESNDNININDINDSFDLVDQKLKDTQDKNTNLDATFQQLIINAGSSNSEVVAGRHDNVTSETFNSLPERLDNHSSLLAQIAKHTTDWINVLELGVKKGGVIDNADLLQTLLDTVPDFSVLYLPAGVYRLSHGLINSRNVSLQGVPMGQYSWSSTQDTYSCLSLDAGVSATTILKVTDPTKKRFIKDIMIASQSAEFESTGLIPIAGSPNAMYSLIINDAGVNGLDLTGMLGMIVENVHIRGCSGYGIKSGTCNYLRNVSTMMCGTGQYIDNDNRIDQLYSSMCNVGIDVVGANNSISSGWIDQIVTHGMLIKGSLNHIVLNIDQTGYSAVKTTGNISMCDITIIAGRVGQYYAGTYLNAITAGNYDKCCALYNAYQIYGSSIKIHVASLVANDAGTAGLCPAVKIINTNELLCSIVSIPYTGESATDFSTFAFIKNTGTISISDIQTGGKNAIKYFYNSVSYKSGNVLVGAGVPTMTAFDSTFYVDTVTKYLYYNIYGGTTWDAIVATRNGQKLITAQVSSTAAEVGSLFEDTADGKLKYKNLAGTVQILSN